MGAPTVFAGLLSSGADDIAAPRRYSSRIIHFGPPWGGHDTFGKRLLDCHIHYAETTA